MPLIVTENAAAPTGPTEAGSGLNSSRRWPGLCLALFSALYFVPAFIHAARDKLWFDEILTFDAASLLPSFRTLWSFLKQGVEFNPPLSFLLAGWSESIFGTNEFGLRFPSIFEFWIMALCLYVFLRRRIPWPYAIAGALLPCMIAGRYAHEARPYALVLALAGIALVAWQAAAEGRRRRVALFSLGFALAAALCSQPLAVTLAVPFLAGEITRTVRRKRVDWPVWCAFASATPSLLVLWTLKTAGNKTAYSRFTGSLPLHVAATYAEILKPAIVPLAMALLLLLVLRSQEVMTERGAPAGPRPPESDPGLRPYEWAALVGFALIPFAAVPISTLGGHYWHRYSLGCIIGIAGLAAAFLFRIGGTNRSAGRAVMLAFGACFTVAQLLPENMRTDGVPIVNSSAEIQPFLGQLPSDAPVVIGPPMTFVELEHYSSPELASRLYYLTEPSAAAAIDGDSGFDVKGPVLARFFPFHAHFADYHAFIATHKHFYVVQPIRNIVREYLAGRIDLQPREIAGQFQYWVATPR